MCRLTFRCVKAGLRVQRPAEWHGAALVFRRTRDIVSPSSCARRLTVSHVVGLCVSPPVFPGDADKVWAVLQVQRMAEPVLVLVGETGGIAP